MNLSKEQQYAFDKFKEGENIFITGPGGTGKSHLIKTLLTYGIENKKHVSVCALTGCAAVLLECNAKTIHSWCGIGLGKSSKESLLSKIKRGKKVKNWKMTDILIIDEVSMMSKKLFELLDYLGKRLRNNTRPFGGIQLVFCGDFFQLPPIGEKNDEESRKFCFESELWKSTFDNEIELKTIFRQKDPLYSKILNQIRVGNISKNSFSVLQKYVTRSKENLSIVQPTILYPTKHLVEKKNELSLKKLDCASKEFVIQVVEPVLLELTKEEKERANEYSHEEIEVETKQLITSSNVEKQLYLKVGAQVMCTVNLDLDSSTPVCNGSQGIIVSFNEQGFPCVRFNHGLVKVISPFVWKSENIPSVAVKQVPLILAWALTIHKSQGATLDLAEIDVGNGIFECGQTYVALSRIKSLDGLYLRSFNPFKIKISKKVKNYYKNIKKLELL